MESDESFTESAYLMECSNGKPKLKNFTCLFVRQLFKFGGSQLGRSSTRPTTYILHSGLLRGKSHFTTFKPSLRKLEGDPFPIIWLGTPEWGGPYEGRILLEKGGFSTLSANRETLSEPERGIINTDNLKNFYE